MVTIIIILSIYQIALDYSNNSLYSHEEELIGENSQTTLKINTKEKSPNSYGMGFLYVYVITSMYSYHYC